MNSGTVIAARILVTDVLARCLCERTPTRCAAVRAVVVVAASPTLWEDAQPMGDTRITSGEMVEAR